MSLLADLLSKKQKTAPDASKGIPPTLAKACGVSAKRSERGNRYLLIAGVSLATLALGMGASWLFGRLAIPNPAQPPLSAQAGTPAATRQAPRQQMPARPAPAATIAPQVVAQTLPEAARQPAGKVEAVIPLRAAKPSAHTQRRARLAFEPTAAHRQPREFAEARPTCKVRPNAAALSKADAAKAGALLYAAHSAEQAGDWPMALADYRRALEFDPGNFRILSNAAAAFNNLGMFKDGALLAKKALERKPDYVPAMINAAIAYSSLGNNEQALPLFSAAYAADPGNISLALNLGILRERSGKLDEALASYRRPAEAGDVHALEGMGRIYERQGRRSEAALAYRRMLANPSVKPALKKEVMNRLMRLEY